VSQHSISFSGNEFQTVGAEQWNAHLAKSVLVNGLSASGTALTMPPKIADRSSTFHMHAWVHFTL